MKVLRFATSDKLLKAYTLQMSYNDETKVLSGTAGTSGLMKGFEGDYIEDFSFDLSKYVGLLVELVILKTEKGYELNLINTLKNCNIGNGMPGFTCDQIDGYLRVFRMAVNPTINNTIIQLTHAHEEIEGFDNIVDDTGNPTLRLKYLCDHDPYAAALITKARKKSDMQGKIDFKDSIAYLEAQLDLLTRFILQKHPEETGEIAQALALADDHSVLDIKSMESVRNEFTEKKALVREAQQEYFNAETSSEASNS